MSNSDKFKLVTLAVIELHLSEGIGQLLSQLLSQAVSQSLENSINNFYSNLLKTILINLKACLA